MTGVSVQISPLPRDRQHLAEIQRRERARATRSKPPCAPARSSRYMMGSRTR